MAQQKMVSANKVQIPAKVANIHVTLVKGMNIILPAFLKKAFFHQHSTVIDEKKMGE